MSAKTEQTITDRAELYEGLTEVCSRGITFDDETHLKGLRCVTVTRPQGRQALSREECFVL